MDIVARIQLRASAEVGLKIGLFATCALMLFSCGGGDGVDIGSGQNADPVVVDYPLFYVRKPLPADDMGLLQQLDLRDLLAVQLGGDLYMRPRASASAQEVNLTGTLTNGFGDIRDLSVSPDGEKVLFAMRFPVDPNGDEEDQPFWNIWEYDIVTESLRRIMADDITANEGHDIGPQYLPNGQIIFSSTRQNRSVAKLVDQLKPGFQALDEEQEEPAFVLHIMDEDGTNIQQLSFNQSHDMYPEVLSNGRIMFSRWDGPVSNDSISLYTMNPDGTDLQLLYGAASHDTGSNGTMVEFVKAKEMPDGRVLSLLTPFSGTTGGGDLITIEVADYLNDTQPNEINDGVLFGPAQLPLTQSVVLTEPGVSPGGRFAAAWPLWDGTSRIIVSWSACTVQFIDPLANPPMDPSQEPLRPCTVQNLANPLATESAPSYGVWTYDLYANTQQPIVLPQIGFTITDVAVAQPKPQPAFVTPAALDSTLAAEDAGILHIRSVYDMDGVDIAPGGIGAIADPAQTLADERPARFLRVIRAVGIPGEDDLDFDNAAFGVSRLFGMREIVGYAPIEPDGSVRVRVPADVPLAVEVLNSEGHRLTSWHLSWLQVRPGEERTCNGCHNPNAGPTVSHGRSDAFTAVNQGAPVNGVPFPNTDPGLFPDQGDTMAMTRTRIDPVALELSTDLLYSDVWTFQPAAGRAPDADYSLSYAAIVDTPVPDMFDCAPGNVDCRVVINYEAHIQPLWEVARPITDPMTMVTTDRQCVSCHAFRDINNVVIDPDDRGQLELTGNASGQEPLQMVSFRELLFSDNQEVLQDDAIVDLLTDQGNVDASGDPILEPVVLAAPLSAAGARIRPQFFARFSATGAHPNWLTPDELRLIAEWVDLGAQYYNDPFASVP